MQIAARVYEEEVSEGQEQLIANELKTMNTSAASDRPPKPPQKTEGYEVGYILYEDERNRDLLVGIFPGTYGLSTDGGFLHIFHGAEVEQRRAAAVEPVLATPSYKDKAALRRRYIGNSPSKMCSGPWTSGQGLLAC